MANDEYLKQIRRIYDTDRDFRSPVEVIGELLNEIESLKYWAKVRELTMEKALRIVDAIAHKFDIPGDMWIAGRIAELMNENPDMKAGLMVRQAHAEFVLRVVNDE